MSTHSSAIHDNGAAMELMVCNIRYGKQQTDFKESSIGVRSKVANMFWKDQYGVDADDAVILMCRRSCGFGRTVITLMRRDAWRVVDDDAFLMDTARQTAEGLFGVGGYNKHEVCKIAEMIIDELESLVMLPPESDADERKIFEDDVNRSGLIMIVNGVDIVKATC